MSVTVDFCFNAGNGSLSFKAIAECVNDVGCQLQPYEGNDADLFCRFLSLELTLGEHDLENDRDCDFETYRFILDTRTAAPDSKLRGYQLEATALAALALLTNGVAINGILTYELQHLLARYELPKPGEVFDLVTDRIVVYPGHLLDLAKTAHYPASPGCTT